MSYLPELRDSLVEAARQTYAGTAAPTERKHRRRWLTRGGAATVLASAVAVAVAVLAVVGLGHRPASSSTAATPSPARIDLRRSAAAALDQLVLPPGAVASGLVRGTPIQLWSVSDQLRIPGHVDVYRIWRLHERPDRVISFIAAHRPAGSVDGIGEVNGASAGGNTVIMQSQTTIGLLGTASGIWREFAVDAVSLPGGGTALRVDSEAGWLPPRPVSERIPSGVSRVQLYWARRGTRRRLSLGITNPAQVHLLVALFNSLPSARTGTGICKSAPEGVFRFAFEGAERSTPVAIASWALPCQNLSLTIGGAPSVPIMAGAPTQPVGAQIIETIAPWIYARRVSGSATTVNSSQGCAINTPQSSASSPSAPGAGGASCTSASRSTTSASSP